MEHFGGEQQKRQQQSKILAGILVITFGTIFLLDRTGVDIPNWIYSWKMIIIAVGFVSLVKHNFRKLSGYVLIAVGTIFLINDFEPGTVDAKLIIPVVIIAFGITILWKGLGFGKDKHKKKHFESVMFDASTEEASSDYFETRTIFGGTEKNIVSKNFRGAKITTVFGGTDLDLTNADLKQPATIDSTTLFGGLTIMVPADWKVQSELTMAFGAVEDKRRNINASETEDHKILTLTGNCFFGGVEIQSYL